MQAYKQEFIELMVRSGVLLFGEFTTKSGRQTPYFINTGKYETGGQMARLGHFYAEALLGAVEGRIDFLFGPAYKGIPLVVATAVALQEQFDRDLAICFNRKEKKDHGEGGALVGHMPHDGERVVIIEDVTTAGTSIREALSLMQPVAELEYAGIIVSVDRMERGTGEKSALQQIRDDLGIPVHPIVTLDEVVEHLHNREIDGRVVLDDAMLERIAAYRKEYGA
ncbi:MAG: orotate phosphoribosyltransferase [Chitinivibrionales bacterium]|nr:orotate phosphoribosyltransferase [Chitinivibrionales bacterium]